MNDRFETLAPIRVLVADDHPVVMFAIESLISSFPNMTIAARANDATELFTELASQDCNLVVTDLYMPGNEAGLPMLRRLTSEFPGIPVVVLTMAADAKLLESLLDAGVHAVVSKRDRIDLLHVALVTAAARERYIGPSVRALISTAHAQQRFEIVREKLTRRELEVIRCYASGMGVGQIATLTGRSVKTISAQKCTALRKLGLGGDADLFHFAADNGLIPGETEAGSRS